MIGLTVAWATAIKILYNTGTNILGKMQESQHKSYWYNWSNTWANQHKNHIDTTDRKESLATENAYDNLICYDLWFAIASGLWKTVAKKINNNSKIVITYNPMKQLSLPNSKQGFELSIEL